MLTHNENRIALLTPDAEALQQADKDKPDWCPHPDPLVGRHEADHERTDTDDQERGDQRSLATDLIANVAKDDAPQGPGDEANRVGAQGSESADQWLEAGKEQLVEDERSGCAVDEEVRSCL